MLWVSGEGGVTILSIIDSIYHERQKFVHTHTCTAMHNTFQRDLYRLRLETARSYVKAVTASLTPVTSTQDSSLKISAQVGNCVCLCVCADVFVCVCGCVCVCMYVCV